LTAAAGASRCSERSCSTVAAAGSGPAGTHRRQPGGGGGHLGSGCQPGGGTQPGGGAGQVGGGLKRYSTAPPTARRADHGASRLVLGRPVSLLPRGVRCTVSANMTQRTRPSTVDNDEVSSRLLPTQARGTGARPARGAAESRVPRAGRLMSALATRQPVCPMSPSVG
jgi:hypothetical protein